MPLAMRSGLLVYKRMGKGVPPNPIRMEVFSLDSFPELSQKHCSLPWRSVYDLAVFAAVADCGGK